MYVCRCVCVCACVRLCIIWSVEGKELILLVLTVYN